jgi:ABC-type polysaccharide/polyol phosphate transport system ATPase subunit
VCVDYGRADRGNRRRPIRPALADVDLHVLPGEAVALIGANGAGKTTTLRVAGGGIPVSAGRRECAPRIGLLLDLGLSFHPGLTGVENGSFFLRIQGLSARDARKGVREAGEFAELSREDLERPLRQYSAGMLLRLAFALGTHLRPELLLIDELLAVGDVAFQIKCGERLHGLRSAGTGVLFASHDLAQVAATATHVLWLQDGRVKFAGPPREAIAAYRGSAVPLDVDAERLSPESAQQRTVTSGSSQLLTLHPPPACSAVVTAARVLLLRDPLGVLAIATIARPGGQTGAWDIRFDVVVASGAYELVVEYLAADGAVCASVCALSLLVAPRPGVDGLLDLGVSDAPA